jgi:hypothetical protein
MQRILIDEGAIWQELGKITDPEIPVLSLVEMKVIRSGNVVAQGKGTTDSTAARVARAVECAINLGRFTADVFHLWEPWAAALTDQLVSNVKVSGSNRVVVVNTNLPDSAQEQLVQLPARIMTQMMMNAMLPKTGDSESGDSSSESSPAIPLARDDPTAIRRRIGRKAKRIET